MRERSKVRSSCHREVKNKINNKIIYTWDIKEGSTRSSIFRRHPLALPFGSVFIILSLLYRIMRKLGKLSVVHFIKYSKILKWNWNAQHSTNSFSMNLFKPQKLVAGGTREKAFKYLLFQHFDFLFPFFFYLIMGSSSSSDDSEPFSVSSKKKSQLLHL